MPQTTPFKTDELGIRLFVRIKPNSRTEKLVSIIETEIKTFCLLIRIKAPATENKANRSLVKFVARNLNYPQSKISLRRGQKSRDKTLHIEDDPTDIKNRLKTLISAIEG